jgi:cytochrome c-type protein NapC/trimethylamine-N-oxide reductase cytochrome c-type subunit TorC
MAWFGSRVIRRVLRFGKRHGCTFVIGFVFAMLCFVALNAIMKPFSRSEYCGSKCHEMSTAYQSWELSVHGANKSGFRVECVDCHLPSRDRDFGHVVAKAYSGCKDIYKHHFGGRYDAEKVRKKVLERMSNQRCLGCHDDLLARPGGSDARIAHLAVLSEPDAPESRCVGCHEDAGHQRQNKLFSP